MNTIFLIAGVGIVAYNIRRIINSPPVSVWSLKRWYTTVTIFVVAAGFVLLYLRGNYSGIRVWAHAVSASGWVMMIAAPCSISAFNTERPLKILRGAGFLALAIWILVYI